MPFSTNTASDFYKEAKAVYDKGNNLTGEQKWIANFWDCNPFKMNIDGHVMYATKKISPGGHWINITALACKQTHADVAKSTEAYACGAITIADAVISCWDEKYRSIVIRPETYINLYIDQNWMPELQTPPFPEYTSGHSVISASAATVLTKLFGDNLLTPIQQKLNSAYNQETLHRLNKLLKKLLSAAFMEYIIMLLL